MLAVPRLAESIVIFPVMVVVIRAIKCVLRSGATNCCSPCSELSGDAGRSSSHTALPPEPLHLHLVALDVVGSLCVPHVFASRNNEKKNKMTVIQFRKREKHKGKGILRTSVLACEMAAVTETLECVALLERDRNEDLLTTWSASIPKICING